MLFYSLLLVTVLSVPHTPGTNQCGSMKRLLSDADNVAMPHSVSTGSTWSGSESDMTGYSSRSESERKMLIIYTGGTIGMKKNEDGVYAPQDGFLQEQIKNMFQMIPGLKDEVMEYDILAYKTLLDSSNMTVENWNAMLTTIEKHYNQYAAFVIIHGTDTLAYTASALSYAIDNLSKPVVITGSQVPLAEAKSDGLNNIITSLVYASSEDAAKEVVVVFDNEIIRGTRSRKSNANRLKAFESRNQSPLGEFHSSLQMNKSAFLEPNPSQETTFLKYQEDKKIPIVWVTPGTDFEIYQQQAEDGAIHSMIFMVYGVGNIPSDDKSLIKLLQTTHAKGINTIYLSQVKDGFTQSEAIYEAGSDLATNGVVSGRDMTIEAAYTKMMYLLSNPTYNSYESRNKAFTKPLRGDSSM